MRRPVLGTTLLALVLVASGPSVQSARADEDRDPGADDTPSRADVRDARDRALEADADVDDIQAALDAANAELEAAAVAAARAAEDFNGARWRLQEARTAERRAARASRAADRAEAEQKQGYRDALLTQAATSPELSALDALAESDGMSSLLDRSTALERVQGAFDDQRTAYLAAAEDAETAEQRAEDTAADAEEAAADAREARDAAQAAVADTAALAGSIAAEKSRLLRRLARLEGISLDLAEDRQAALEEERRQDAAEQAQQDAEQAQQDAEDADAHEDEPADEPPADDPPADEPPAGDPPADDPGPVTGDAGAAVAFARDQLGEPYRWAAAGPDAWDCSGLTMGAWQAGGKSLPHYSVAQYEQSTPIGVGDLRAGDLVFWGSSSSPSSIFHVALYAGDGMIVHAPRTGRPVSEESMYYWTPPTFFARP